MGLREAFNLEEPQKSGKSDWASHSDKGQSESIALVSMRAEMQTPHEKPPETERQEDASLRQMVAHQQEQLVELRQQLGRLHSLVENMALFGLKGAAGPPMALTDTAERSDQLGQNGHAKTSDLGARLGKLTWACGEDAKPSSSTIVSPMARRSQTLSKEFVARPQLVDVSVGVGASLVLSQMPPASASKTCDVGVGVGESLHLQFTGRLSRTFGSKTFATEALPDLSLNGMRFDQSRPSEAAEEAVDVEFNNSQYCIEGLRDPGVDTSNACSLGPHELTLLRCGGATAGASVSSAEKVEEWLSHGCNWSTGVPSRTSLSASVAQSLRADQVESSVFALAGGPADSADVTGRSPCVARPIQSSSVDYGSRWGVVPGPISRAQGGIGDVPRIVCPPSASSGS